jgi:hypothetical protein
MERGEEGGGSEDVHYGLSGNNLDLPLNLRHSWSLARHRLGRAWYSEARGRSSTDVWHLVLRPGTIGVGASFDLCVSELTSGRDCADGFRN